MLLSEAYLNCHRMSNIHMLLTICCSRLLLMEMSATLVCISFFCFIIIRVIVAAIPKINLIIGEIHCCQMVSRTAIWLSLLLASTLMALPCVDGNFTMALGFGFPSNFIATLAKTDYVCQLFLKCRLFVSTLVQFCFAIICTWQVHLFTKPHLTCKVAPETFPSCQICETSSASDLFLHWPLSLLVSGRSLALHWRRWGPMDHCRTWHFLRAWLSPHYRFGVLVFSGAMFVLSLQPISCDHSLPSHFPLPLASPLPIDLTAIWWSGLNK